MHEKHSTIAINNPPTTICTMPNIEMTTRVTPAAVFVPMDVDSGIKSSIPMITVLIVEIAPRKCAITCVHVDDIMMSIQLITVLIL